MLYTIIAGINGTGKSSLTGALKSERTGLGIIVDADKLTARAGNPLAGGREAIRMINDCLDKGLNFTQETTLSGAKTVNTIRRVKQAGYQVHLLLCGSQLGRR